MQTIYETEIPEEQIKANTRQSYITKIEYDWLNRFFTVHFMTITKKGTRQILTYPFTYHEFNQFFTRKKKTILVATADGSKETNRKIKKQNKRIANNSLFANPAIKQSFKRWQWEQLVTNLWFKAVHLATWKNVNKLTNRLSEMRESKQYINECPTGILDFDNSKYKFEIPLILPTADYLVEKVTSEPNELNLFWEKVKDNYLQLLRDQFGPNMEIDYVLDLSDETLVIDLLRLKDQEPNELHTDKPEFVHPGN